MADVMSNQKVGFIGLGKMGAGMCSNIQKTGFPLTVYNRTRAKMDPFLEKGASAANSPREAAENADVVFSSLMDDDSVIENVSGGNGVLSGLKPNGIHVSLTTILPATATKLEAMHKEKGCHYIAAPVGGRPDAAEAGELMSFLAGDAQAIKAVTPIVESYSEKVIPVGANVATANAMKVSTNYMGMVQLIMMGEMFTFAEKSGLNPDMVLMMLHMMYSPEPFKEYATKIRNRDFDKAGFDLTAGLKDALIFEKAFIDAGIKPGTITAARENLVAAVANGLGNKDWSALTEMTRRAAGLD